MLKHLCTLALVLGCGLGAANAEEIKGEFVKFADGKLTVKVADKEKEFKVSPDLKIMVKKELLPASEALGKLKPKAKPMLTLTVEKDEVKDIKVAKKDKDKAS